MIVVNIALRWLKLKYSMRIRTDNIHMKCQKDNSKTDDLERDYVTMCESKIAANMAI